MVHGKESCGSEYSAPAAPVAVKGAIEQPAKQVLLGEWGEAHGPDGVSNAQPRELGGLLGVAQQLRKRRDVTQNSGVAESHPAERQPDAEAEQQRGHKSAARQAVFLGKGNVRLGKI